MAKHRRPTTAWSKQTPSSNRTVRPRTTQIQITRPPQSTTNEASQAASSVRGNYSIDGNQDEATKGSPSSSVKQSALSKHKFAQIRSSSSYLYGVLPPRLVRLPGEPSRTWRSFEEPEKPSTDSGFLDGPGNSTDSADLSYPVVHFKLQEIGQENVLEEHASTVHEEKDDGTALAANDTDDKPENEIEPVNEEAAPRTREIVKQRTKFKSLAKSLSVLNRSRAAETTEMNREQSAFLSKFGMSIAQGAPPPSEQHKGSLKEYLTEKFVLDPSDERYYTWLGVITCAFFYNLIFIAFRCVFVDGEFGTIWIVLFVVMDVITDGLYLVDAFFNMRTGFLEQGLLVRDVHKIQRKYRKSWQFRVDVLSVIPLDYFCEIVLLTPKPLLRFNRLIKFGRMRDFLNDTETRISVPNAFRVGCVVLYILVLIHYNACVYFSVSKAIGIGLDSWVYGLKNKQALPPGVEDCLSRRYIYSFYWSTLMLTTIGEVPGGVHNMELVIMCLITLSGVLIFATIVGNVGSMISNMSAARSEFQNRVDGIKQYMDLRRVSPQLARRVIKWFDYLWANNQTLSDQQVLEVLPSKLQAEIAMHVHFETLRKVRIFQDCEAGLLAELVLKLQLQVFSPMDYVCRKGDIGREMYIVKRGKLQVVGDDGVTVYHTLQEGAVFGELSILNIAGSKQGNRRSASIRSVGYTDLFVLKKSDLWDALREYPDARKGREILRKDNLIDENAPMDTKTPEELAEELLNTVGVLQTRLARLKAEHVNTENKLKQRIEFLERQLRRFGDDDFDSDSNHGVSRGESLDYD